MQSLRRLGASARGPKLAGSARRRGIRCCRYVVAVKVNQVTAVGSDSCVRVALGVRGAQDMCATAFMSSMP